MNARAYVCQKVCVLSQSLNVQFLQLSDNAYTTFFTVSWAPVSLAVVLNLFYSLSGTASLIPHQLDSNSLVYILDGYRRQQLERKCDSGQSYFVISVHGRVKLNNLRIGYSRV